jgi:hypothetical protein
MCGAGESKAAKIKGHTNAISRCRVPSVYCIYFGTVTPLVHTHPFQKLLRIFCQIRKPGPPIPRCCWERAPATTNLNIPLQPRFIGRGFYSVVFPYWGIGYVCMRAALFLVPTSCSGYSKERCKRYPTCASRSPCRCHSVFRAFSLDGRL